MTKEVYFGHLKKSCHSFKKLDNHSFFKKRMNNGRELKLKLDSKTRWGSLHDACERFLKLLGPVKEALNHREMTKPTYGQISTQKDWRSW